MLLLSLTDNVWTRRKTVTSQIFIIQTIKLLQIDRCHHTLDVNYPPVRTVAVKLLISSSISLHRMLPRTLQNVYFISIILNMILCRFIISSNKLLLTVVLSLKSNCALYWTNNIAASGYGPTKGSLKCLTILLPNTKTSQSIWYFIRADLRCFFFILHHLFQSNSYLLGQESTWTQDRWYVTGWELTRFSALWWLWEVINRRASLHLNSLDFLHVQVFKETHREQGRPPKPLNQNISKRSPHSTFVQMHFFSWTVQIHSHTYILEFKYY